MPPKKRDPLSATISKFRYFNGIMCEISCYGSSNDYVCRISQQNTKPCPSDMTDGYLPPPDAGLLWIRSHDNHCMITGFVRRHLAPDSDQLDDLIDDVQEMLTVDQIQSTVNIEIVGTKRNWVRRFNGEDLDQGYKK